MYLDRPQGSKLDPRKNKLKDIIKTVKKQNGSLQTTKLVLKIFIRLSDQQRGLHVEKGEIEENKKEIFLGM